MYIVTRIDTQSAKDNNRRNTKVGRTAPLITSAVSQLSTKLNQQRKKVHQRKLVD